jgi:hypothetical protein
VTPILTGPDGTLPPLPVTPADLALVEKLNAVA